MHSLTYSPQKEVLPDWKTYRSVGVHPFSFTFTRNAFVSICRNITNYNTVHSHLNETHDTKIYWRLQWAIKVGYGPPVTMITLVDISLYIYDIRQKARDDLQVSVIFVLSSFFTLSVRFDPNIMIWKFECIRLSL